MTETVSPRSPRRFVPIARLVAAWLITLGVLPYAWGRTVLIWMSDAGAPEVPYVILVFISLLVVVALTYGLGGRFQQRRTRFLIMGAVFASWFAANTGLILLRSGTLMPRSQVIAGYLPATLWVIWTGWMCFLSIRWLTRIGLLAVAATGVVVFLSLFRVAGLTGASNVDFAYRSEKPSAPIALSPSATETTTDIVVDITQRAGDSPQYLGPDRNGVLPDVILARDWKKRPPKLLWRKPVGIGWSGFAVVGDYALTQEQRGEFECVVCYEAATGNEVWIYRDETEFHLSMGGPGPRATLTVDAGRVYSMGATGILNCLEGSNGTLVWSVNILKDAEAKNIAHGVSASPLVTDEWVIVCPTGKSGPSLVAYDRETGGRVWSEGTWRVSYSSPVVAEIAGVAQILNFTSKGLVGHNFADGKVLWEFPWTNSDSTNVAQPIVHAGGADRVLIGSGYGAGSALVSVQQQNGQWTATAVWTSNRMKTKFTTAVIHGDHVYGLDDGIFECIALKTGKRAWKRGRYGHGQILLAGNLILVQTEKGDVVLVEPNPQKLIELGKIPALNGKTWNIPALTQGKLLVRNDREAACYELPSIQK